MNSTFIFGLIAILSGTWAILASYAVYRLLKFLRSKGIMAEWEAWDKSH